ncbi:hypothetical protein [Companilactobacillus mishanensis]|nr:hypothetical protein [Companilactobacillus mishanensis]
MRNGVARFFSWLLIVLLFATEVFAAYLMWLDKSPFGTVVHGLIGIAFVLLGILAMRNINKTSFLDKKAFSRRNAYILLISNLFMLLIISLHDCDHMRQAMGWNYHFTVLLLLVNIIEYLPNLISVYLVGKQRFSGIIASIVSGPLIAVAFLKLHLMGSWIPVWGPWNRSFFALKVDQLSWWILVITAVVGITVGMIAIYLLGKVNSKKTNQINF